MSDQTVHKSTRTATREAIAAYLRRAATAFERGDPVPVDDSVTVDPAPEVEMEVDVERKDDELSYEVEFAWPAVEGGVDVDADVLDAVPAADAGAVDDADVAATDDADEAATGSDATEDATASDADDAGDAPAPAPDDVEETVPAGSKARFEIYRDRANEWRWRLRHDNGNIIANGGEGYRRKAGVKKGIRSVKANAGDAAVDESD